MANQRQGAVSRKTRETDIKVSITIDGKGECQADTGIPFVDHMLELFAKHGLFDLEAKAVGDIQVDYHHTMEDLGLAIGEAFAKALGDKAGIRRHAWCALPMDEALVMVAVDLSGRPFLVYDVNPPNPMVKDIDAGLFGEFFRALAVKGGMNLHIRMLSGSDCHHVLEAAFKGLAKCLDNATVLDPRVVGVPSTKGVL